MKTTFIIVQVKQRKPFYFQCQRIIETGLNNILIQRFYSQLLRYNLPIRRQGYIETIMCGCIKSRLHEILLFNQIFNSRLMTKGR